MLKHSTSDVAKYTYIIDLTINPYGSSSALDNIQDHIQVYEVYNHEMNRTTFPASVTFLNNMFYYYIGM